LASFAGCTTREIAHVDNSVQLISQHVDSLEQADSRLTRLRNEKQAKVNLDMTLKEKEETSLGDVQRQSNIMQERLETLSEAARRMEEIIAELERAQQRRRREGETPRYQAGEFAQLKGMLRSPIKGQIVSAFGWKKDKITNLSSFSPGIDIRPMTGHNEVRACAPGRVVYVGQLRGYNNFVILEHDDGFYTTYAGLREVGVELDELLDAGDKVGSLGDSNFHFEIRRGREHLDPVIWLDIDEF
jgi:septal ring factor EnvC (AmiA/AmiB activator)